MRITPTGQAVAAAMAAAEERGQIGLQQASYLVNCAPSANGDPRYGYSADATAQDWEQLTQARQDAHTAQVDAALAADEGRPAGLTPNRAQGQSANPIPHEPSGAQKLDQLRLAHAAQRY